MEKKLAVIALGSRNSGKSNTWNSLFGSEVRTGKYIRPLYVDGEKYIHVYLVSGSPEEREMYVGDLITAEAPRIVLCSVQYAIEAKDTFEYFYSNGYSLFVHWLNPGYSESFRQPQPDELELVPYILSLDSLLGIRSGQEPVEGRVAEMRNFLRQWAEDEGLLES